MKSIRAAVFLAAAAAILSSAFAENHVVSDSEIQSYFNGKAADALRVMPGDTITLPELATGEYAVGNARFATLGVDGVTVTANEPGILGIHRLSVAGDIDSIDNTMPVIIMPERIGNGRIFISDETHWSFGQQGWCTTDGGWIQVGPESTDDYPRFPNDIAIIIRKANGWAMNIPVSSDASVGAIYYGSVRDLEEFANGAYCSSLTSAGGAAATLTFARSCKGPALFQLCPNFLHQERKCHIGFAGGLTVAIASDLIVDFGWDEAENKTNLSLFKLFSDGILNIPDGKEVSFVNSAPHQGSSYHSDITLYGVITGAGTIANRSRENMLCEFSDAAEFSGTILEAAFLHSGFDRDATTWFSKCDTLDSAALEVRGYVTRQDYRTFDVRFGAGYARIGSHHTWPGQGDVGNRLPGRALISHGGHLDFYDEQKAWSAGAVNTYETGVFAVSNGYTYLNVIGNNYEAQGYPETLFKANQLVHENKATMSVRCNRLWSQNSEYCERVETCLPAFASAASGGIVPWMAAWADHPEYGNSGGWQSLRFPVADAGGNLRDPGTASMSVAAAADMANAVCSGADLTIASDKTINSLALSNQYSGSKKIGEGRTLTIASGGLIMNSSKTRIGENDWNSTTPSAGCGTLAFGATAYVFPNNPDNDNMVWIMANIVAPYGFVCGFPGYLAICGDQTGIDDEIVVQAGQLTLGLVANSNGANLAIPCVIDVPVRIVGGGSKLVIAPIAGAAPTLDRTKNVYFDDVGGFAGKLDIPSGAVETCFKCFVDGVSLARGTWGAPGSGATHVDDAHFSGMGVLSVLADELSQPSVVIIR